MIATGDTMRTDFVTPVCNILCKNVVWRRFLLDHIQFTIVLTISDIITAKTHNICLQGENLSNDLILNS